MMELTTNDYIRAAKIVATCRAERLPIVLGLLEQAGMEIERNGTEQTDLLMPGTMDALNMLCDIPKRFAEHFDESSDAEQWGKIGDDGMLFIQVRELRKIAEENLFDWDELKESLMLAGALVPNKDGRYTHSVRIDGKTVRCAVIRQETEDERNG